MDNSIKSLTYSLNISNDISLPDWEKADLYYMLGLTYLADGNTVNTLEFTNESLDFFKNSFQFNRALDCYIILGITYKKSQRYNKALETYQLALKIVNELNIDNYKGKIYQNLGSLYSNNDPEKSIDYYRKSLAQKNKVNEQLITIFSVIKEYAKLEKWDYVQEWVNIGFDFINTNSKSETAYRYHFLIYESISLNRQLDESIALKSIEFFQSINDYRHLYKYSILLGNTLYQKGKYKAASFHYHKAHLYLLKSMKINQLEDF